jgi:hypothetical protein
MVIPEEIPFISVQLIHSSMLWVYLLFRSPRRLCRNYYFCHFDRREKSCFIKDKIPPFGQDKDFSVISFLRNDIVNNTI